MFHFLILYNLYQGKPEQVKHHSLHKKNTKEINFVDFQGIRSNQSVHSLLFKILLMGPSPITLSKYNAKR